MKTLLGGAMALIMATTVQAGQIDHVILAAPDLDKAAAELGRRAGITTEFGGVHVSGETANRLASLGDGVYLEVAGPAPGRTAASVAGLATANLTSPTPAGFAVRVTDAATAAGRFKAAGLEVSPIQEGGRTTPEGQSLHWKGFAVTAPQFCSLVPFFIEWGASTAHPSTTSPKGAKLTAVRITHPKAAELTRLYATLGVPLRAEPGPARMEFTLNGPKGSVTFGAAPSCES